MSIEEIISSHMGRHVGERNGDEHTGSAVPRHRAHVLVDDEAHDPTYYTPRHRALSLA